MNKQLNDFIALEAGKLGYTVIEVELKGRFGLSVEITLDKSGGVTLEECSRFNRTVSLWLEKSETGAKGYTVEVASPGLDRVLKNDTEFVWAVGKKIKINTDGNDEVGLFNEGKLKSADGKTLTLNLDSGEEIEIEKKNIVKAQLSPEIKKRAKT